MNVAMRPVAESSTTEAGNTLTLPGPVTMNATDSTGIVALDDGAPWAGAPDLALPFP